MREKHVWVDQLLERHKELEFLKREAIKLFKFYSLIIEETGISSVTSLMRIVMYYMCNC